MKAILLVRGEAALLLHSSKVKMSVAIKRLLTNMETIIMLSKISRGREINTE